jgi:predicted permease
MKQLRAWIVRLVGMLPNRQKERELADEIEGHLQMHIDDNLRAGMTPEQARREAILKLGGVEPTKEAYRDRSTMPFLDNLLQDIHFAIRQLRKNPGFTSTAILMLALGMCASVSIFAFVDATLIKPLPYQNPGRLVGVFESITWCPQCPLSYPDYLDWKKLNNVFSSLDVYQRNGFLLSTASGAQSARGVRVSDGFFRTLGITPVLGRDFYAGEDLPGPQRTVLLSYASWQKRYGGKEDVLGQTVILDGDPNIIIGVLPREFHFAPAEPAEFWTALHASGSCDVRRGCHGLYGVARLKDGVSVQTALANVTLIAQRLEKEYPDSNRDQGAAVAALSDVIVGDIRPILLVLLSGAGLLLLIASINVASLLLVRSESRKREIAVRGSLGASPARIIRQFVTEAFVLVATGTVLGLASASWTMQLLTTLIPANMIARMPFLHDLGLNVRVLFFAGVISLLAAVLFSITPTFQLSLSETRDGALAARSSRNTWRRVGSKLVVLELATAMVLLVGAGLLSKSLYRLLRVDIGLQPDHLVTIQVAAPDSSYATVPQVMALERRIVSRIESLPGVQSVGVSHLGLPLDGNGNTSWFRVLGRPWHGEHLEAPERDVSSSYFTTLGAKLLRGRYFTEAEDASKPRVAIINQTFSRQHFVAEDPIGKQLAYISRPTPVEIVGIVEDIKEGPLDVATPAVLYIPYNQSANTYFGMVVRTSQAEQSLLPTLAATIHQIDPQIVTYGGATMNDRIRDSQSAYLHRSSAWLVGGFAALALLLGVVGLYGVVAYSVSQRTREIGIRMALGADRSSVYQLVLKEAVWLTAGGIIIGLACSVAAATLMRGLLFEVRSWDVPTLATVAAVLGISAILASYLPARRAASVNPVEALRAE